MRNISPLLVGAICGLFTLGVLVIGHAVGYADGYREGRCQTFDAFVVASGFPVDAKGAYKPAECRR
jgi:hypothetical protein